ncbi:hypothetical protein CYMTET_6498 [Cymbomonas tetramitiformis]|uniref:Uncharacterized protein n=1 Tax=Cymbomonas tetramitiformis TaxID=36881 RepID=A0AAE0GXA9_9CHLO|nr:hypothetical protein CYMTET_6498 [Cymbomonas tetramitiformis]
MDFERPKPAHYFPARKRLLPTISSHVVQKDALKGFTLTRPLDAENLGALTLEPGGSGFLTELGTQTEPASAPTNFSCRTVSEENKGARSEEGGARDLRGRPAPGLQTAKEASNYQNQYCASQGLGELRGSPHNAGDIDKLTRRALGGARYSSRRNKLEKALTKQRLQMNMVGFANSERWMRDARQYWQKHTEHPDAQMDRAIWARLSDPEEWRKKVRCGIGYRDDMDIRQSGALMVSPTPQAAERPRACSTDPELMDVSSHYDNFDANENTHGTNIISDDMTPQDEMAIKHRSRRRGRTHSLSVNERASINHIWEKKKQDLSLSLFIPSDRTVRPQLGHHPTDIISYRDHFGVSNEMLTVVQIARRFHFSENPEQNVQEAVALPDAAVGCILEEMLKMNTQRQNTARDNSSPVSHEMSRFREYGKGAKAKRALAGSNEKPQAEALSVPVDNEKKHEAAEQMKMRRMRRQSVRPSVKALALNRDTLEKLDGDSHESRKSLGSPGRAVHSVAESTEHEILLATLEGMAPKRLAAALDRMTSESGLQLIKLVPLELQRDLLVSVTSTDLVQHLLQQLISTTGPASTMKAKYKPVAEQFMNPDAWCDLLLRMDEVPGKMMMQRMLEIDREGVVQAISTATPTTFSTLMAYLDLPTSVAVILGLGMFAAVEMLMYLPTPHAAEVLRELGPTIAMSLLENMGHETSLDMLVQLPTALYPPPPAHPPFCPATS